MFFVCKDVLCGLRESAYIKRKDSKVILTIPNDSENPEVFSFDDFPIEVFGNEDIILKRDIVLRNVSVKVLKSKTFVHSVKEESNTIYALLRGVNCIPDDVFIKATQSHNFKLIKKITYTSCEPDYGSYPATVYFVKINITPSNLVQVYFAGKDSHFLEDHIAFYHDYYEKRIRIKNNLQTFTINGDEFISLSELD